MPPGVAQQLQLVAAVTIPMVLHAVDTEEINEVCCLYCRAYSPGTHARKEEE
jgi:hypothetical protein